MFWKKRQKYKIYLFRHGQTTFNRDGIFTGHLDPKLTNKGKRQAQTIARELKSKKFQVAIHSSLSRSIETLKPVLKYHPECKTILQDDRIIERGYGELQGTTHEKFIEQVGKQLYDLMVHGDAIENLDSPMKKKVEKFLGQEEYNAIHRGYKVAVPGGESFRDVERRVKKFIKYLKKYMKKNKVNVAISAHGNSIRLFRKIMERASMDETIRWAIPYDKVFTYEV